MKSLRAQSQRQARGVALPSLLISIVFAVALTALAVVCVGWPAQVRVISPRLGMPLIDRAGAMFEVRFATSLPLIMPDVALSLESPLGSSSLPTLSIRFEGVEAVLSSSLPNLPDGAYSLRVKSATQDLLLPKAVFLKQQWQPTLRLVQIADLPPPGRESLMRLFVDEMRVQQPDAVLVTGDINYTGSASNIDFIHEQLAKLDMPVIMTAGNHEREAWHRYLRVFGARDHRTHLGPLTILSLDTAHGRDALTPSMFRWLSNELNQLDGRTALIQVHHPVFPPGSGATSEAGGTGGFLRGFRQAFLELCEQHDVAIVLSGHWHQDAVFDQQGMLHKGGGNFPGTKYVVTTALGADVRKVFEDSVMENGYRWLEFKDGKLVSYSANQDNSLLSTPLGVAVSTP